MNFVPSIDIDSYTYHLPDERIARYPVEPRDCSSLLVYKNEEISKTSFQEITDLLPATSFLVFNNTKVIPARLFFQKATGSIIEVFLLNPVAPSTVISQVMETTTACAWACMIGNKKRWKNESLKADLQLENNKIELTAELIDRETNIVRFEWKADLPVSFAEIVKAYGQIPLPPYLDRDADTKDLESYQTVYSKNDGAVAAPTAGLHFSEQIFEQLAQKNIQYDFLTLHVGAGTFQPIKVQNVVEHTMHTEQIVVERAFIEKLLSNLEMVVPVGTTSMRSLESLYWFGAKLLLDTEANFFIEKLLPYQLLNTGDVPSASNSLKAVLAYMQQNELETLVGESEIFIFPSYKFQICKGLITNFHQPHSTLVLLVAAFVGENWRKIYDFALENDFRFLSYGDSSLLIP